MNDLVNQLMVLQEEYGDIPVDVYCETHGQMFVIADVYQWRDNALVITVRDDGQ